MAEIKVGKGESLESALRRFKRATQKAGIDEDTEEFDLAELEQKGFKLWTVNPATYVVFDCIGTDADCIGEMWSKFFKEFLPQMGYEAGDEGP